MRLQFQVETAGRQLRCNKMLCLPKYSLTINMFFPNMELFFNKAMPGNNCF